MRLESSLGFEAVAAQLVTDYAGATRVVGEKWQYVLVLLIALGVAWLSLSNVPRWRAWLPMRVVAGGTVWPGVGLLSLSRIFSAGAVSPCARICVPRRTRVVGFLTQKPLTFNPHIFCRSRFQRAISPS